MSLSTVATSVVSAVAALDPVIAVNNPLAALTSRPTTNDEWEKERSALYQQLDEKVRNCLPLKERNRLVRPKHEIRVLLKPHLTNDL